jgi:hypothetical protein
MNGALIDKIVQAVLYEGYILYPYRRGTKNEQRWTFGNLFPRTYSEIAGEMHSVQLQCLLRGSAQSRLKLRIQFLQLIDRQIMRLSPSPGTPGEGRGEGLEPVDQLEIEGKRYQTWQEAIERTISIEADLSPQPHCASFSFLPETSSESLPDRSGKILGTIERKRFPIEGDIEISAEQKRDDLFQLTVRVMNLTPVDHPSTMSRPQAQKHSMASTHIIASIAGGNFLSSIDPPPDAIELTRQCKNIGAWPVLVGNPGETDAVLASPIILYDYPQIAPESPGDLFDGTEIDEILSLRVMTLTDEEKRSAADLDDRAAALLHRTESLAREQMARLHGTMRPPRKVQAVHVGEAELRAGDRVILRPRGGADAFDVILRGKSATIAAIEQDYENQIHLAVTIDDDPGADIGAAGKIGHRFFFRPDEVEPIPSSQEVHTP